MLQVLQLLLSYPHLKHNWSSKQLWIYDNHSFHLVLSSLPGWCLHFELHLIKKTHVHVNMGRPISHWYSGSGEVLDCIDS